MQQKLKIYKICKIWLSVMAASAVFMGQAQSDVTYTYDALGRLIKTDYSSQGSAIDYAYDPAGNRSTINVSGTGVSQFGAVNDAANVDYGAMTVITPLANDSGGIAPITLSIITPPSNGAAVIAANGADIEYTPNAGFQGADSLTYSGTDINGPASEATISLTVAAPVVFDITADASGTEGTGITFTVTKTGTVSSTQTVDAATVPGTASSADLTALSQTLTFLSVDVSKTFTVLTTEDSIYEGQEAFTVQLSNPSSGALLGTDIRTGTILDDDGINFAVGDASISEGGDLSFVITKTGTASMGHSFTYATTNGTANSNDYTPDSGTVTFAAADVTQTVTVTTAQDTTHEPDETVLLNLSAPTNGATITDSQGVGTITDNDAAPAFSVNNVSVSEGGTLSFTVTKTGATSLSHNINYATANHTAISSDYTATSGTLSFSSGETSKTVSVVTTENGSYENNEVLRLNLSAATNGATISDSQGDGTINNDDAAPSFAINNVTKVEGQDLTFTITKTGATLLTHKVNYATANSSAVANSDYISKSGARSFAHNVNSRTVTITGVQDSVYEGTENFRLNISSPTNGAVIGDSQGVGYITDDETPNAAPNAVNDTYSGINKTVWTTLNVRGNDSDPDGDGFTITSTSGSTGQLQIINGSTQVRYICSVGCGTDDLFYYTISDGALTDTASVVLHLNSGGGGGLPLF